MTREEEEEQPEENETMTCMLLVFNAPALFLFDTGASIPSYQIVLKGGLT